MKSLALGLSSVALALAATVSSGQADRSAQESGWQSFRGNWSAVGERQALATEGNPAVVVRLSGTLLLTAGEGLSRGFRAEALGFDDGAGVNAGRMLWTDDRGDRIFSVLRGEPVQTGRRVTGTITGGTGRYAGLAGQYTFTWQYVLAEDDAAIQGRAANIEGRFRLAAIPR